MRLTLIRRAGDCSDTDTCPAKYATDRGTRVFIGRLVTDPADLAGLPVGPGEAVVEVPEDIAEA